LKERPFPVYSMAELQRMVFHYEEDCSVDPRLKTSEAYDAAWRPIYNALPDCRECHCG
jgi:hypothetical protein